MSKSSHYQAREPDASGYIRYPEREHQIWHDLIQRQLTMLPGRACQQYMDGLAALALPQERIPQLSEINRVLRLTTGWEVAQVPALIDFGRFFQLLADKRFPVATFIRSRDEFDYLQEPDIFHEVFGHCPLLTNPAFAEFTHTYGKLGLTATPQQRIFLARLYWFTVEFGLVQTDRGLRIYGGGILSSPGETLYAMESEQAERHSLSVLDALRTPYRIDIMQPVYFILDSIDQLFEISRMDLMSLVSEAMRLGLHPPKFPPKARQAS